MQSALEIKRIIEHLQKALEDTHWNPDGSYTQSEAPNKWSFGTAITLRGEPRPILRGFLQPVQRIPILRNVPDRVAQFLLTIEKGQDYLDREDHGFGIHYHYLNSKHERSNVILSWDTRWTHPAPPTTPPTLRALFVEPHGNPKDARFKAKPRRWGLNKRQTMHTTCGLDLRNWPIGNFKCASNDSEIVYPLGRTLTPHPNASAVMGAKLPASTKKSKKRKP
jgi:hypothetical protein